MSTRQKKCFRMALPLYAAGLVVASYSHGQGELRINPQVVFLDSNTLTLSLPYVFQIPFANQEARAVHSVILKYKGDNLFRLESFEEFGPDDICTRSEVFDAIPKLNLSMTLDEMEATIGCPAVLYRGEADLKLGLLYDARWTGIDNIPYTRSAGALTYLPYPSDSTFPDYRLAFPIETQFIAGAYSSPAISVLLREGIPESITYTTTQFGYSCPAYDFTTWVEAIEIGSSYEEVVEITRCDGDLISTSISSDAISRQYKISVFPGVFSTNIPFPEIFSAGTMTAVFRENITTELTYDIQFRNIKDYCEISELEQLAGNILTGSMYADIESVIPCQPFKLEAELNESSILMRYIFRTAVAPGSYYITRNRSLLIEIKDGIIQSTTLSRIQ